MKRFAARNFMKARMMQRTPVATMKFRAYRMSSPQQQKSAQATRTTAKYQQYKQYKHQNKNQNNQWWNQHQQRNYSKKTVVQEGLHWGKPVGAVAAAIGGFLLLNQLFNQTKTGSAVEGSTLMNATISQFQRDFLVGTYGYLSLGLMLTAGATVGAYRSGLAAKYYSMAPMLQWVVGLGGMIGLMTAVRSIPKENSIALGTSWVAFNAFMGLLLAPYVMFGPQILLRAALYTAGVFGGMTAIALNAEQERFLFMGGALYAGLMVLILTSFSSMLLPARFAKAHSGMSNLMMYGGLALFTAFILYDTHHILRTSKALEHSHMARDKKQMHGYYMVMSIKLYMDIINIFTSFVQMQGRRK